MSRTGLNGEAHATEACRGQPSRVSPNIRRLDWLSSSLMLSGGARHAGVLAAAKPAHPEMWITAEER
jgi:hypothetical protein